MSVNRLFLKSSLVVLGILVVVFLSTHVNLVRNALADTGIRGTLGDKWADIILGQPDFTQGMNKETVGYKVGNPGGTYVNTNVAPNTLYVSDSVNSRILGYSSLGICNDGSDSPCTEVADCGLGFTCTLTPIQHCSGTQTACTTDSECTSPATCVYKTADIVIGQPDMTHSACNGDISYSSKVFPTPSDETLCSMPPSQISPLEGGFFASFTVDSTNIDHQDRLYYPDWINNRVLMYEDPFLQAGTVKAGAVWGQTNFNGHQCNQGGSPTASTVCFGDDSSSNPAFSVGVDVDSEGNLWVADTLNNRVLRFPFEAGSGMPTTTADLVLGQADFTSNGSGTGINELNYPGALRVDALGNVYVTDTYNNRIIKYTAPLSDGMDGEIWGSGFSLPTGVEFERDENGDITTNVWVNNTQGHRVELWDSTGTSIVKVLYTDLYTNPWSSDVPCSPDLDYCFQTDSRGSLGITSHGEMFIASSGNNQQVLHFPVPIATPVEGTYIAADYKLYPVPYSVNWLTSSSLESPHGIAVYNAANQSTSQVIVSDGYRILFWNDPSSLANKKPADGIIGAADGHAENAANYGRIHTDNAGHLYVTHKETFGAWKPIIEIYDLPLSNGQAPSSTIDATQLLTIEGGTIDLSIGGDLATGGIYPSDDGSFLWIAHPFSNRVVRIDDPLTAPVVSVVLGQADSASVDCNRG